MSKSSSSPLFLGITALSLRVIAILYSIYHDNHFTVKYTDVDYAVVSDGARYVVEGGSPYMRSTYRYTPLLAYLCVPNILLFDQFGKVLFCLMDVLVAWLIYHMQHKMRNVPSGRAFIAVAISILFNPIVFNVSTRGNSDQLVVLWVVLTLYALMHKRVLIAGVCYALAMHTKIYPVIYFPAIFLFLDSESYRGERRQHNQTANGHDTMRRKTWQWLKCFFFSRDRLVFSLTAFVTVVALTAFFYHLYGFQFLYETYLYHFVRSDNRHNFSVYFYQIYLGQSQGAIALLAFVPQFLPLLAVAFAYHRDLPLAMFIQTVMFVMFNKVMTVQYFVWYLSLLGLIIPQSNMSWKKALALFAGWMASQSMWLNFAYELEFLGKNTFYMIWCSGLAFFAAHCIVVMVVLWYHRYVPVFSKGKLVSLNPRPISDKEA